jgi:hypothetical protein
MKIPSWDFMERGARFRLQLSTFLVRYSDNRITGERVEEPGASEPKMRFPSGNSELQVLSLVTLVILRV